MAELQTDEEKVEAIKQWWKKNGVAVVAGITIGLGGVLGWQGWSAYQQNQAAQASLAFEQLLTAALTGQVERAEQQAQLLRDEHSGSAYAMFAELTLAKLQVETGDLDAAAESLRAALDRAPDPALARVAAIRLVRVLIEQDAFQAATDLIDQQDKSPAFSAEFAALRGDIAAAEGRITDARAAYQAALDGGAGNAALIELKLLDLAHNDT